MTSAPIAPEAPGIALGDAKVKGIVSNIRNLPTPPIVFQQIQKVMSDPNVSATKIAAVLAEDPAMSAKVLKLTNSAYYGLAREVESVKQAVLIVGIEAIKNLVLSASVLDMFKGHIDSEYQERFWRHSLATAFCCRMLVRKLKSQRMIEADAAFSAGLLHDIGKVIISCFLPAENVQFKLERGANRMEEDFQIEQRLFGYTHAQLGGFLALQWKLPQKLAESIALHHYPTMMNESNPLTYMVNFANYLSKKTFYDQDESHLVGELSPIVGTYLGIADENPDELTAALREEYVHAETFMSMAGIR